jgi:tetratricopeptide (TPR) repeat protein
MSAAHGLPLPEEALMAERLFDEGDFVQAAAAFEDAARRDRSHRDALTLRAAESWREEGRIEDARPLLSKLRLERLSSEEALRADLLRAELALLDRDSQRALGHAVDTVVYRPRRPARAFSFPAGPSICSIQSAVRRSRRARRPCSPTFQHATKRKTPPPSVHY